MSDPAIYLPPLMFQEIRFPNSVMRWKMLNRLNNPYYRESKFVEVSAGTAEEVESLGDLVRHYEDQEWIFEGLFGGDNGAELCFYRLVLWTPEEIQEAKDWLEANPNPLADPVVWRKFVTTVYEEGVKDESA